MNEDIKKAAVAAALPICAALFFASGWCANVATQPKPTSITRVTYLQPGDDALGLLNKAGRDCAIKFGAEVVAFEWSDGRSSFFYVGRGEEPASVVSALGEGSKPHKEAIFIVGHDSGNCWVRGIDVMLSD